MEGKVSRVVRLGAGLLGLMTLGWVLTGHAAKPVLEGLPLDWTHRHVIFSQPATAELARLVASDPRYWQQWYRQNVARVLSDNVETSLEMASWRNRQPAQSSIHRDWSQGLGSTGTVGAGNYPAKYSFGITTANCGTAATPDFVVYSTGLPGSGTQASIVAFDNLYNPGCTGTVPSVYWAYNTNGQILTSPVFSRDGSQLAFVQTSGGVASLVLLKWQASTTETVTSPGSPALLLPPSSYFGCSAPCMTTIALESGSMIATADTTSSVFYDYVGDTAWVGDASGWLHQFTPVFNAAPAEIRTAPWPVQVNATTPTALTSPVHDHVSGNVFVEDQGGFLYSVNATSGAVVKSGQLDHGPAASIVGGLVVDPVAGKVYVFASSDGTTTTVGCAPAACSAVYQLPTNFTGSTTAAEAVVGVSSAAPNPLYDGAFDSAYQASLNATGNIYVCGDTGVNPMLYQVPITAGTFGTALEVAPLTAIANHRACSPVTDVLNPSAAGGAPEERVFFSVINSAHPTICAAKGCALSLVSMPWQAKTTYSVGQEILVVHAADGALYINVATNATPGTSGATAPTWPAAVGTITTDGTVTWLNQGTAVFTALGTWAPNTKYNAHNRIVDSNGNVEVAIVGGGGRTSGGTVPTWATTPGLTTTDGTVTWVNAGVLPAAALQALGGTSGIIIDNTVSQTTQAGASELYFSTLANQACPTTTTGCAVQASQSQLLQ
jgi:hypothetical protein